MPRKQSTHSDITKTSSGYIHPSLVRCDHSSASTPTRPSESSVTERIEYLRGVQSRPQISLSSDDLLHSTHAPARLPKKMAGPPPPRSWTQHAVNTKMRFLDSASGQQRRLHISSLPGIRLPDHGSLLHSCLKTMASNWDLQVAYQGDWLSTVPMHLKSLLLRYIERYGPPGGIAIEELKTLMASEADTGSSDSTGCEEIIRLDLGGALGRNITVHSLKLYILSAGGLNSKRLQSKRSEPLESWEDEELPTLNLSQLRLGTPKVFYEHLTHLSLADPGPISWPDFVDKLSPHLGRLTHLSLAYWPSPTPLVSSTTTTTAPLTINDDEAKTVGRFRLQKFSRHTSNMQYLCLTGCEDWLDLLRSAPQSTSANGNARRTNTSRIQAAFAPNGSLPDPQSSSRGALPQPGVDWAGTWGRVSTLDVADDYVPTPGDVSLLTLADTMHLRHGKRAPRDGRRDGGALSYYDALPDTNIGNLLSMDKRVRKWLIREHEKRKVVRFVRAERAAAGGGHWLTVKWGSDRDTLLSVGWSEAELFSSGL